MKYDIFISYKQSDEFGNITEDYQIAKKLYNKLIDKGYSAFFSTKSLEQIGSSRYKADIDEALDSATVMIVVLTKAEYAASHWVQYEWDSFYNDYLSGVKPNAKLFTLTKDIDVKQLPRTLRNVQNFEYDNKIDIPCKYILNAICENERNILTQNQAENRFEIISGKEVTLEDIREAVLLDTITFDNMYYVDPKHCQEWFNVNPDIYIMIRDKEKNRIVSYTNITPVTDECYNKIKSGEFLTANISNEMILSYDMPFSYSVYFFSIVIHPDYKNSEVFFLMINAIIDKFIQFAKQDVFIKRMIADAVTENGEKFCKLFGMKKVINSKHYSTVYEITMIPPAFKIISKKVKELFDLYQRKYNETPYLFDDNED